ncbi:CSC1-like protein At1g69450 [Silene latifolia]|uniref:CSC1-like protein At1g69450 n=1 Tax=Silene latifolia TaxID=37657 RepID=UPI003D775301
MIVSALLTSVGINSGLCVLFFTLYSILRKQPGNSYVYIPRHTHVEKEIERSTHFLQRLIPTPTWVRTAWKLSEEELLSTSGLDAVVFIRIITFSLKIFLFTGALGLFVLLPIHASGTQVATFVVADIPSVTLDLFTITNVNSGSKWLWAHCVSVYLVTGFVCFLLYHEYDYICSKRVAYFYSSKPRPRQFTILVRGIPVRPGSSISKSVDSFFMKYYPSTYLSHAVIHRTDSRWHRVEVRSAFVFFRSRYGAAIASQLQQSENPTEWVTEKAPDPDDVYWPFFQSSFLKRWLLKVVIILTYILVTILFLLPVLLVQGLTNLSQLEVFFPFLQDILSMKYVRQTVTGYLPNLILLLFLLLIPPVMEFLASIQGHFSQSTIQRSACSKFLWFMIWNIFFANVLSGSVFTQLSELLDLKNVPSKLAVSVPAQASFFIAYVVTSGWTSTSSDLFRIIQLIQSLLQKCCCCSSENNDDEYEAPYIRYHKEIPKILFFGLLGITYFFLAPLMLPFLLVYFSLAYIIFKNQFINVYSPKFETAGKFWPNVHNSMIFSLLLMHSIALGIFTLKKLQMGSTLMIPLPVMTLLFNEYCRKRFLPNFLAYSVENLIKRDSKDANDHEMPQFFDQLITAYKDPALSPDQLSNTDGLRFANHSDNLTDSLLLSI